MQVHNRFKASSEATPQDTQSCLRQDGRTDLVSQVAPVIEAWLGVIEPCRISHFPTQPSKSRDRQALTTGGRLGRDYALDDALGVMS